MQQHGMDFAESFRRDQDACSFNIDEPLFVEFSQDKKALFFSFSQSLSKRGNDSFFAEAW